MEQRGFFGDSRITVVRFDPELWELVFMGISQTGERTGHTAREWCEQHRLAAAINAGMYAADRRTHLGYLRSGGPANNGGVNSYQSVAEFYPRGGQ
ncbi:hypothetical protein FJY70_03730, partial [candidate division WOR-3 bacterium]|nr:hypothetical protein [candidate division WOR-3 bacterium]